MHEKTWCFRLHKVTFGLLVGCLIIFIAACQSPPPPKPVSAVCNPVPVSPPPLPNFIESVTYQGPELYGPVHSLHVYGDTVYLGLGDSFAVMDASNTAEPQLVGSVYLNRHGKDGYDIEAVRHDIAYLSSHIQLMGFTGYKIDLSNPANPVVVICDPPIYEPGQDILANRYEISPVNYYSISIREWSEDGSELQEISTFTLYHPARIEWRQPAGQLIPLPYRIEPAPMPVAGFTFDERYLYVLNEEFRSGVSNCCGRLSILDLENPAEPENINTFTLPVETRPEAITAMGDYLFITLFNTSTTKTTIIYDMSDKTDLVELVSVVSSRPPQVHSGYAYFPSWTEAAIDIWDIQAENGPEVVGKIFIPEQESNFYRPLANNLAFVGDYIYLANGGNLEILDNSDPANPIFIDQVQFPLLTSPTEIAVTGNGLAGHIPGLGIQTLAINEAGQMGEWQPLRTIYNASFVHDFSIVNDYLYIIDVSVDDVSEETSTTLFVSESGRSIDNGWATSLSIPDFGGRHMAAASTHLFLAGSDVQIVDITSPTNPTVVGEILLESAGVYFDLAVWEDTLYLASGSPEQGLWRYDISNPLQPQLVDFYPYDLLLGSIAAGDGFVFGIDDEFSIHIIDMHSSDGPVLLETFRLSSGTPRDLAYQDGVLYVAVVGRGVAAVRLNFEKLE